MTIKNWFVKWWQRMFGPYRTSPPKIENHLDIIFLENGYWFDRNKIKYIVKGKNFRKDDVVEVFLTKGNTWVLKRETEHFAYRMSLDDVRNFFVWNPKIPFPFEHFELDENKEI